MAPRLSYGRHQGPPNPDAKVAAVLLLMMHRDGEWRLPLTKRQAHLPDHPGQISLPGGLLEPGESAKQGALRESEEEIGIPADEIRVLGQLEELNLYNSNFRVLPWVGLLESEPEFHCNEEEVAELFEVPLGLLMQPESVRQMGIRRGSLAFSAPCFDCAGHEIWGATSVILSDFAALVRAAGS